MTEFPPYLVSYNFGVDFIPVPTELWRYFGRRDDCLQIDQEMHNYPGTQGAMIDGTNLFGALFVPLRNPEDAAIWLDQGYVPDPRGSYLEFAGWLWDRQTAPLPGIDDTGGTALVPGACVPGLVQWYWEAPATATMAAPPARRSHTPPLRQFLEDLALAERRWRRTAE